MSGIFTIAEIGINHNSDLTIAKKLIDMVKLTNCTAVKFQKRTVDKVYTKEFLDSPRESPWGTTQREQKNGLEFGKEQYDQIDAYCKQVGVDWFASAWDIDSQLFLDGYKLKYNKVASPMAVDSQFVLMVAEENKPTFLSTGKVTDDQTDTIVSVFRHYETPLTLMHCVLKYPCPDDLCNLKRIAELKKRHPDVPVGYSNHNPSILPLSLAVAMGAEALECHVTLDRTMYGTDQPASFEMMGLYYVVRDAERVRGIIG